MMLRVSYAGCAAWALGLLLALAYVPAAAAAASTGNDEGKPFGIASFTLQATARTVETVVGPGEERQFYNEPYDPAFTQADGHPWALTATVRFVSEEFTKEEKSSKVLHVVVPTRDPKDVVVDLPPGLLGNPTAVPRCPTDLVLNESHSCPADTQVGYANARLYGGGKYLLGPIINMVPEVGQSAEFGIQLAGVTFVLTAHVIHGSGGYDITVVSNNTPLSELVSIETTFWGVPADPSHDVMRGLSCKTASTLETCAGGNEPAGITPVPFLTWPSDCAGGPLSATVRADSWQEPSREVQTSATLPAPTGCSALSFQPSIEVLPDTPLADAPVGLGVNVNVPQPEQPKQTATPELRDATVTLPEGMSVSPGIVDGIEACQESGPEGINFSGPESEEVGLNGELQLAPGHCPDASTVGTAEASTPLLPEPVKGHVYLAEPGCGGAGQGPCTEADALDGNLYKLYLELGGTGELADAGVNLKFPGNVEANPATGQLTTTFVDDPQLPFGQLRIRLNGGPRAPLDNPFACGQATTTTDFVPWSAPGLDPEGAFVAGAADATPTSFFEVEGCAAAPGLAPGFLAGTVTPNAGRFSAFTMNLTRYDREQYLKGIQLHTPPGLVGMLASVPLCGEPQADQGTCPESAKIGTTRVASGAGSHPFEIEGDVYLTTSYRGAPFGLSIVTDAVAGPFNLGRVVVRARIDVDPNTSALTVTTDETGPYAIPQILDGVPLRLKRITVDIDRPEFMFNPTNCGAQQISANISGSGEAVASVSSPFAVGGCKSLAFQPSFTAATSGRTSRKRGASLEVKLTYPKGAMGDDANIASVKVELPKHLPSYLSTLQKACPAKVFTEDPAACPSGAVVGIAKTKTPVLPVELKGPVYFVSEGAEWPELIIVLQGDGVRVDLAGTTFISKRGITSTTFKTVPDVPVETFELYLPQGQNHALAANGNLCKQQNKLKMPTEFVAQNGAVVRQKTKIAVTGCKGGSDRKHNGHVRRRKHGHGHLATGARKHHEGKEETAGRTGKAAGRGVR